MERELQDQEVEERRRRQRNDAKPVADLLQEWLAKPAKRPSSARLCRTEAPQQRAIDYSLNRWPALMRYQDDVRLPIDD